MALTLSSPVCSASVLAGYQGWSCAELTVVGNNMVLGMELLVRMQHTDKETSHAGAVQMQLCGGSLRRMNDRRSGPDGAFLLLEMLMPITGIVRDR